jgi:P4 family phage/plasmid primase-like protien
MNNKFLTYFPDHAFRYIDQTGEGRLPVACSERKDDLNLQGYESYFTVNGFKDAPNAQKENCTSLNAFFVDIDGRKDLDELEEIKAKLDPTFIVETQNGYHIYWCLDEPIYKEETTPEEWKEIVARWERIEQSIVSTLKADPVVKDLTRILRVPQTYYWKKTGDKWKSGTEGVFKIKGIYKQIANNYTMDSVESAFPPVSLEVSNFTQPTGIKAKNISDAERKNFFDKVNEEYPIEERDSFRKLISNNPESLPADGLRNKTLHITACLMRQAGWSFEKATNHITKVGWHGIETERGGAQEITNTIRSAYDGSYAYSHKNEIIAYNMSPEESQRIQEAYAVVLKTRREKDKIRFSTYEHELLARYPYLKKNEIGIVFQYKDGVYVMLSDQEVSDMVLNGLYEDMLWGYRTKKNVSDKLACLISIIPELKISDDKGYILNVQNGLLNIYTRELVPHTPSFVSLIQYPVVYDPSAEAPVWEACVKDWMSGPEQAEKTRLIQQFCGYILSSSMLYDRALFMVGDGGNGKSTFIDTISMVIGPEGTAHIDLEDLYGDFGMHGLIGKRLNVIEEVAGNYYQSNKLKKLISGEAVTIKIKYKPQFTFRPQAKFVFSVNLLPRVDDTSTATERRICAVAFLNNYRKNPNFQLRSSVGLLAQELSGILNWMIDGANDLAKSGKFVTTEEQTRLLNEYREENSSVEGFLSQCIVIDADSSIESPYLYAEYKRWAESEGGRKTKANITFTKEVRAYGAKDDRFTYVPRESGGEDAKFVGIRFAPHWMKRYDSTNLNSY